MYREAFCLRGVDYVDLFWSSNTFWWRLSGLVDTLVIAAAAAAAATETGMEDREGCFDAIVLRRTSTLTLCRRGGWFASPPNNKTRPCAVGLRLISELRVFPTHSLWTTKCRHGKHVGYTIVPQLCPLLGSFMYRVCMRSKQAWARSGEHDTERTRLLFRPFFPRRFPWLSVLTARSAHYDQESVCRAQHALFLE